MILPLATFILPEYEGQYFSISILLGIFLYVTIILFVFLELFILGFANPSSFWRLKNLFRTVAASNAYLQKVNAITYLVTYPVVIVATTVITVNAGIIMVNTPDHIDLTPLNIFKRISTMDNPGGYYIIPSSDLFLYELVKKARMLGLAIPINPDHTVNVSLLKRMYAEAEALAQEETRRLSLAIGAALVNSNGDPETFMKLRLAETTLRLATLNEIEAAGPLTDAQRIEKKDELSMRQHYIEGLQIIAKANALAAFKSPYPVLKQMEEPIPSSFASPDGSATEKDTVLGIEDKKGAVLMIEAEKKAK